MSFTLPHSEIWSSGILGGNEEGVRKTLLRQLSCKYCHVAVERLKCPFMTLFYAIMKNVILSRNLIFNTVQNFVSFEMFYMKISFKKNLRSKSNLTVCVFRVGLQIFIFVTITEWLHFKGATFCTDNCANESHQEMEFW